MRWPQFAFKSTVKKPASYSPLWVKGHMAVRTYTRSGEKIDAILFGGVRKG